MIKLIRQPYVVNFDSASSMVKALAESLRGRDFRFMGMFPRWSGPGLRAVARVVNGLSEEQRKFLYSWGGTMEALTAEQLQRVSGSRIAEWVVRHYPNQSYPAVAVGSANGAALHLWAALGIPWLPQTFLLALDRGQKMDPDDPEQDMNWGAGLAPLLLENNPELQLHHMADPNQDRLMLQRMGYFRVKYRSLPEAYRRFLRRNLRPGGRILSVECELTWPAVRCGERHVFQFGGLGGLSANEYLQGSERVRRFLRNEGASRKTWHPPAPNERAPEAEWGFEPLLRTDLDQFAREEGYRLERFTFNDPQDLSPPVADLYRWWNRRRGIRERRVLVECFNLLELFQTIRTGSIPYWLVFNKEPSEISLREYLEQVGQVDEIFILLFSHGMNSVGFVPLERWEDILKLANKRGDFIGVEKDAYPRDLGVYVRYDRELRRKISARYPEPRRLRLRDVEKFLQEYGEDLGDIQWPRFGG